MCWYSAEHAGKIAEAEVGQRLVTRKVHGCTWAVKETDTQTFRPTPVCLLDRTRVLFRPAEPENGQPPFISDTEAVFRMLKPRRDVFQLADGREIDANALPANLVFDVLEIPGKEEFSSILKKEDQEDEPAVSPPRQESLLHRVLALF